MPRPSIHEVSGLEKSLNYDFVDLRIADKRVTTRLADTQQKRYVGLSNSEKIGKNEGMLFEYPQEKKHRLVMRDMNFPIDVVHVGSDGRVNKWGSMSESGEAVEGISKYAIELPHGWCEKNGLEEGDPIHLLDPPEEKQKLFKARRYVDDPSEAPDDVEVQEGPQGGFFYETEGGETSTDDGERHQPYPQTAQSFQGEIADNFSPVQKKMIESSISTAEEKINLSTLQEITSEPPFRGMSEEHGGQAFYNPDTVWLNPDKIGMDVNLSSGFVPAKYDMESEQSKGLIFHELMHIAHAQIRKKYDVPDVTEWDEEDNVQRVEDEISLYAASVPSEMVPEVGVLLLNGEEVSDEVLDLYYKYGGPEI